MARKEAVSDVYDLIRSFWPEFSITKDDLIKPTGAFVLRFYTQFVNEICEKISWILGEESHLSEFDEVQEFSAEVVILCRVTRIWKYLGVQNSPILTDFYDPFPKRVYQLIKLAAHLMIFVCNAWEEIANDTSNIYKQMHEISHLKTLKQQILQDTAENAQNLALLEDKYDCLKSELEIVKKNHDKMLRVKAAKEIVETQKSLEIEILTKECEDLEYKLRNVEVEEQNLTERVISDDVYNHLKAMEMELSLEAENLSKEDEAYQVGDGLETVKQLEGYAKNLQDINFESLKTEEKYCLDQELNMLKIKERNIEGQLNLHNSDLSEKSKQLKKCKERLEEALKQFKELQAKTIEDINNVKNLFDDKNKQHMSKLSELNELQKKIADKKNEFKKVSFDIQYLDDLFSKNYSEMLEFERNSTNNFKKYLAEVFSKSKLGEKPNCN